MIMATECWNKSLVPLMKSVREHMGSNRPVYLTFDIDSIDPSFCPGTGIKSLYIHIYIVIKYIFIYTGTPEVGGLTSMQALEIIRGLRGINLVATDLVEVSIYSH